MISQFYCSTLLKKYVGGQLTRLYTKEVQGINYDVYKLNKHSEVYMFIVASCPLDEKETIGRIVKARDDARNRADHCKHFACLVDSEEVNHVNLFALEMIYEYSENNLFLILAKKKGRVIIEQMRGVIKAMKELEEAKMWHGELKPNDIFFKEETIKVTNSGIPLLNKEGIIAELLSYGLRKNMFFYYPPELSKGKESVSSKVDVYSFGLILYQLLAFKATNQEQTIEEIKKDTPELTSKIKSLRCDEDESFNEKVVEMLLKVLNNDPEKRPSFEELDNMIKRILKNGEVENTGGDESGTRQTAKINVEEKLNEEIKKLNETLIEEATLKEEKKTKVILLENVVRKAVEAKSMVKSLKEKINDVILKGLEEEKPRLAKKLKDFMLTKFRMFKSDG